MRLMLTLWPGSFDAHAAGASYLAHASSFGSSVEKVKAFEDSDLAFSLYRALRLVQKTVKTCVTKFSVPETHATHR